MTGPVQYDPGLEYMRAAAEEYEALPDDAIAFAGHTKRSQDALQVGGSIEAEAAFRQEGLDPELVELIGNLLQSLRGTPTLKNRELYNRQRRVRKLLLSGRTDDAAAYLRANPQLDALLQMARVQQQMAGYQGTLLEATHSSSLINENAKGHPQLVSGVVVYCRLKGLPPLPGDITRRITRALLDRSAGPGNWTRKVVDKVQRELRQLRLSGRLQAPYPAYAVPDYDPSEY